MKAWRFIAMLAISAWVCSGALADGLLLAPSHILRHFTEQSQVALVDVKPDRTASVDLFISLEDTSGESHKLHFLLPLQTMPKEFHAEELTLSKFREENIKPIDTLFEKAATTKARESNSLWSSYFISSMLTGPFVLLSGIAYFPFIPLGGPGTLNAGISSGPPQPRLSVQTQHTRADVYAALKKEELAALAELGELPANVGETLVHYADRPFALIQLQTVAAPAQAKEDDSYVPVDEPGVHFNFTQEMLPKGDDFVYDYPLGTGSAWAHPIPVTQVYVTASHSAPLSVYFPDRPQTSMRQNLGQLRKARSTAQEYALAYAADGRQVHVATYVNSNPNEDVCVLLSGHGLSEFATASAGGKRRLLIAWLVFPLLGLLTWAIAFRVVVWNAKYAEELGLWSTIWQSWVSVQALVLVPIVSAFLILLPLSYGDYYYMAIVIALVALIFMALLIYTALKRGIGKTRGLLWRSVLAALLAAAIYVPVGIGLVRRLIG